MGDVYLVKEKGVDEAIFSDQGLAEISFQKGIGHVKLNYNKITQEHLDNVLGMSKEVLAEALFKGDLVEEKMVGGEVIYTEAKPLTANVTFGLEDVEKIRDLVDSGELENKGIKCENFKQVLKLHQKLQLKEYNLLVELNPVTF